MDISGVSSRVSSPTPPGADDLTAILSARVAMDSKVAKVAAAAVVSAAAPTVTLDAANSSVALSSGKVDMYL